MSNTSKKVTSWARGYNAALEVMTAKQDAMKAENERLRALLVEVLMEEADARERVCVGITDDLDDRIRAAIRDGRR